VLFLYKAGLDHDVVHDSDFTNLNFWT